jgi:hypothetical protein
MSNVKVRSFDIRAVVRGKTFFPDRTRRDFHEYRCLEETNHGLGKGNEF